MLGFRDSLVGYTELKYSSLHENLFLFLDKNFIFYPGWGNPDGRGNPDGWGNPDDRGNPDGFFADFHRPDYPNTPVCYIALKCLNIQTS